jgi:hypothetical protein
VSVRLLSSVLVAALAFGGSACFVEDVAAGALASLAGKTGSCDRRSGSSKTPQAFCQEIEDTVASSQFKDDCEGHLGGTYRDGDCPRDGVIAGCKLRKVNKDHSVVTDWYYPGDAHITSKNDVAGLCADSKRYDDGADLVTP